jgi:hypothetical protein
MSNKRDNNTKRRQKAKDRPFIMQKYSILNRQASLTAQGPQGLQFELTLDAVDADEKAKRRKAIRRFYFFSHLRNILNKKKTLEKISKRGIWFMSAVEAENMLPTFFALTRKICIKNCLKILWLSNRGINKSRLDLTQCENVRS